MVKVVWGAVGELQRSRFRATAFQRIVNIRLELIGQARLDRALQVWFYSLLQLTLISGLRHIRLDTRFQYNRLVLVAIYKLEIEINLYSKIWLTC